MMVKVGYNLMMRLEDTQDMMVSGHVKGVIQGSYNSFADDLLVGWKKMVIVVQIGDSIGQTTF